MACGNTSLCHLPPVLHLVDVGFSSNYCAFQARLSDYQICQIGFHHIKFSTSIPTDLQIITYGHPDRPFLVSNILAQTLLAAPIQACLIPHPHALGVPQAVLDPSACPLNPWLHHLQCRSPCLLSSCSGLDTVLLSNSSRVIFISINQSQIL